MAITAGNLLRRSHRIDGSWLGWLRAAWWVMVDPDKPEAVFRLAPALGPEHLRDSSIVPDRETLIRELLPKHAVVAEVGTETGRNAATILAGAEPRELHLLDIDFSKLQRELLEPNLSDGTVRLHEGDSSATLASFPDEHFDWIYIDGDHTFAGVQRDIDQAKRKVKPTGFLVFNDYIFFSHMELQEYGVVQAVNQLCHSDGWAIRYLALDRQMYCDVALVRMDQTRKTAS